MLDSRQRIETSASPSQRTREFYSMISFRTVPLCLTLVFLSSTVAAFAQSVHVDINANVTALHLTCNGILAPFRPCLKGRTRNNSGAHSSYPAYLLKACAIPDSFEFILATPERTILLSKTDSNSATSTTAELAAEYANRQGNFFRVAPFRTTKRDATS